MKGIQHKIFTKSNIWINENLILILDWLTTATSRNNATEKDARMQGMGGGHVLLWRALTLEARRRQKTEESYETERFADFLEYMPWLPFKSSKTDA